MLPHDFDHRSQCYADGTPLESVRNGTPEPKGPEMDPQATLERFLEACDALNDPQTAKAGFFRQIARQEAVDALRDLLNWTERGGFLPDRKKIKNLSK